MVIGRRLEETGLTHKIGSNKVRAIRINVSGNPEDMAHIERERKLDEWCSDNLKYFTNTFGKENIVVVHLHREVATHKETIETLQNRIHTIQTDHSRQIRKMQQKHDREIAHKDEVLVLKVIIAKTTAWFPHFRELLYLENLCCLVRFSNEQTATLIKSKPLEYAGELYSEEHKREFTVERITVRIATDYKPQEANTQNRRKARRKVI